MRRVHPDRVAAARQARVGAALGTVAMNDVGSLSVDCARYSARSTNIARSKVTAHADALDAQRQARREIRQNGLRALSAGG